MLDDFLDHIGKIQPGEKIVLDISSGSFYSEDKIIDGEIHSILRLAPNPKIEFEFHYDEPSGFELLNILFGNHEYHKVEFNDTGQEIQVVLSRSTDFGFIVTPKHQRVNRREWNSPETIIFTLINYWKFIGQPQKEFGIDPILPVIDKIYLEGGGLSVLIEELPNLESNVDLLKSIGGHAITHIVKMEKTNEDKFTNEDEVHNSINRVIDFLSFSCGLWVTPAIIFGISSSKENNWECWKIGKSHQWKSTLGWNDEYLSRITLPKAFPGFMDAMNSSINQVLTSSINWYLLSNFQEVIDGSIVLSQIALESLAYHQIVGLGKLSNDGFNRLSSSDQIRLLISGCGIDPSIPDELPGLQRLGKELNFDGPDIIAQKRNATVHPSHSQKDMLSDITFGAWNFSMWYLELVILSVINYDGFYYNRLNYSGCKGEKELVPWEK